MDARPAQRRAGPGAHDAPYTHRFYLDADAIGETGILLHNDAMVCASRDYVRRGIARQGPERVQPGEGRLRHQLLRGQAAVRGDLLHARRGRRAARRHATDGGRALAWLAARVRADGTVDQTGNTRTGFGQERGPQGNIKTMS